MPAVILESVSKVFRHRPALFNWLGRERTGDTRALDQVSLAVPSGSVLVLLGPNGSGKTTTLKLVSTMLLPDAGRVLVQGADTTTNADAVRERVGFAVATERSFFPRLSARRIWTSSPPWMTSREKRVRSASINCSARRVCAIPPIRW